MDFYYIYTSSLGRTECAKDGFCVGAFLFTFFFTLSRRLWLLSLFIFTSSCLSYAALRADLISLPCCLLFEFVLKVYVGCSYFDWLRAKLKRTGHSLSGVILAHDHRHARLMFMEHQATEKQRELRTEERVAADTKNSDDRGDGAQSSTLS